MSAQFHNSGNACDVIDSPSFGSKGYTWRRHTLSQFLNQWNAFIRSNSIGHGSNCNNKKSTIFRNIQIYNRSMERKFPRSIGVNHTVSGQKWIICLPMQSVFHNLTSKGAIWKKAFLFSRSIVLIRHNCLMQLGEVHLIGEPRLSNVITKSALF